MEKGKKKSEGLHLPGVGRVLAACTVGPPASGVAPGGLLPLGGLTVPTLNWGGVDKIPDGLWGCFQLLHPVN